MPRTLQEIARDISRDMHSLKAKPQVSYAYAWPYLEAMQQLESLSDMYGCDSAKSVVLYFLANAGTWRGENARRIKAELNQMLKDLD